MLTGRMPHEIGIAGNAPSSRSFEDEPGARTDSLGHVLRDAGYTTAYAGKWHATQASAPPDAGFDVIRPFGDAGLAEACAAWLGERNGEKQPFFLCASFDDPHTICEFARGQPMPYGDVSAVDVRQAPPLPANFQPAPFEAEAVRFEKHAAQNVYGTREYTPQDWRTYRHAYRQLVERADAYLGRMLDTLDRSGLTESTLIMFTSDHGDGDAAHQWNQKTALFEECTRVPLIVAGPGVTPGRRTGLASASLDLLPTVAAAARAVVPDGLSGRMLDLASDAEDADRTVVVETLFERPRPPLTHGRALYAGRYKYTVYSWGRHREQLHDLSTDPGEQRNLAVESRFDDILEQMRHRLLAWCRDSDDRTFLKRLVLPRSIDASIRDEIFAVPY